MPIKRSNCRTAAHSRRFFGAINNMAFSSVCMSILLWSLLAVCGATVFAHQGKVVNGTQAQDGEYPFVVSLRRAASGRHSCGASMLNRGWVLTAAHCVSRSQPEAVNIQYGSNELDPNSTKVANVSQIYVHEEYKPEQQFINDIALLKLQAPIAFGAKVKAVRLPEMQQFTPGNASAVLLGWGQNAVSIRRASNNAHFCAGTTLSSVWILTAAHCFTYVKRPQDLSVQYGSSRLQAISAKYAHVSEIVKHEGYNPTVAIHDIALLRLAAAMALYNSLKAVELPKPLNGVNVAGWVLLLGWGLNETAGALQNQLQKVQLKLLAQPACRQQLHSFLHSTQLCAGAGTSTASKGQCSGDSGGPLLLQHTRTQIGIVSWSLKPCGSFPGVFTNVAEYTDWIYAKMALTAMNSI